MPDLAAPVPAGPGVAVGRRIAALSAVVGIVVAVVGIIVVSTRAAGIVAIVPARVRLALLPLAGLMPLPSLVLDVGLLLTPVRISIVAIPTARFVVRRSDLAVAPVLLSLGLCRCERYKRGCNQSESEHLADHCLYA